MTAINRRKEMILNHAPLRAIITLALPLMLGNLIQTLYNITDAYWVGKLGHIEFAAISYVWPINFVFLAFGIGMSAAATSLIGQSVGADDLKGAKAFATQFFVLALAAGIVFAALGYALTPSVLRLMGAEGDLFTYSRDYLKIIFLEMPILFSFHAYKSMREGIGDTKSPTLFLGISVILNIILDPIFVLTLGFGVKGAAIATVLSKIAVVGFMIRRMFNKDELIHIDLTDYKPDRRILGNLFHIGIPGSAGQVVSALGFVVMNTFILSFGDNTVAAFGLGNRITSLVMMPAFGLGGALAAFIGQNIGAAQYERAKKAVFQTMGAGFGMLAFGGIFIYLFRLDLIKIFIQEPDVVNLSMEYMTILVFVFPLMAIFQSIMGAFQGSGHTKYVLVLTLSRLWLLRIPMIYLSGRYTDMGSSGIWYAMLVSNVVVCLIGTVIVLQGKWLRPTLRTASASEQEEQVS